MHDILFFGATKYMKITTNSRRTRIDAARLDDASARPEAADEVSGGDGKGLEGAVSVDVLTPIIDEVGYA